MTRVALFGGAFDPPHLGHQAATLFLLACHDVEQVWWLPSPVHAFDKRMAPWDDRVAMCQRALAPFAPGRVQLCLIERELPPPQHTVDTVAALSARHPDHRWSVVIGSDNLDELARWKDVERLRALAELHVLPRAGHAPGALLPAISSSAVRARLAVGGDVGEWLDREVALYIRARSLYKTGPGGGG